MQITLVTPPAQMPVSLADAKATLRIVTDDEDDLIDGLIRAATRHVETFTRRQLVTATYRASLDDWPRDRLYLPRSPLVSVGSATYIDTAGSVQAWDSSQYRVVAGEPGYLLPAYGGSWPSHRAGGDPITVTFTAGYGGPSDVPATFQTAILMLVAHWFENRESVTPGNMGEVPQTINMLLWPERMLEVA